MPSTFRSFRLISCNALAKSFARRCGQQRSGMRLTDGLKVWNSDIYARQDVEPEQVLNNTERHLVKS